MKKFLVSLLIILFASMAWAIPPAPIPPIRATSCTPFIADGVMCYDTDDDKFYIGNGTAAIEFVSLSTSIFPAAGVPVYDTNSSHILYLKAGSNITANKNLTFTTGDSDRTITLSGDPTLADWFDQAVKAASVVTFATVNGLTITSTAGTLTIPNNASAALVTSGNFSITLTSTAATNVTLPIDGTLYGTKTDSITSAALLASLSDETGTGVAVFGTSPTFTTQIISPIVYGSAAASGGITLASTSHSTKGNITVGRLTLSDLANSDGIVFGSLGTATKGIDLSGSGLSGATDYWIYFDSGNTIDAAGNIYIGGYISALTGNFNTITNRTNNAELRLQHGSNRGQIISCLSSSVSHLFGNDTVVGTLTAVTVSGSNLQHADIDTGTAVGDLIHIFSGTGVTTGFYRITAVEVNQVTVDRAPGGTGTNIVVIIYKDVISMHATDATNGQMLTSWSAQNKPMQIGGTVLAATANSLTSTDIVMGGKTEFMGDTYFKAGTSTGYSTPVGAINVTTTGVGNVDGGEDVLMTYSLPTNALSANAKGVRVTVYGTIANNANAKTVKVYFGTTAVYTDSMTINQAYNWTAQYTTIRTGTDTQDVFGTGFIENTAITVAPYFATDTQDDGAAIVIKCTGEGVASNDIIQQGMLVEYIN